MIESGKFWTEMLEIDYNPFERFYYTIQSLYDYSAGHQKPCKYSYTFDTFKEIIFNAVADDEELPDDIRSQAEIYYKGRITEKIGINAFKVIKERILKLKADEQTFKLFLEQNDRETEETRNLLFNNRHCDKTYYYVRPLIQWATYHKKLDELFIFKMFEYGYITGKRDERAKKKERERREKGNKKEDDAERTYY